jgi:hypothetical protein
MKFSTHHSQEDGIQIIHKNKFMDSKESAKFLELEIDKHLNWKKHTEEILPTLSSACYTMRSMYYTSRIATLKIIYFAYFNLKVEYGIIFWGTSTDSKRVFQLQKKIES